MNVRHQILAVKDAGDVIQNPLVYRKAGVSGAFHNNENLLKRSADFNCGNFHSRHHHVFHLPLGELEDAFEHSGVFVAVAIDKRAKLGVRNRGGESRGVVTDASEEESRQFNSVFGNRIEEPHADFNRQHHSQTDPIGITGRKCLRSQFAEHQNHDRQQHGFNCERNIHVIGVHDESGDDSG
jgi:hypothetical protein